MSDSGKAAVAEMRLRAIAAAEAKLDAMEKADAAEEEKEKEKEAGKEKEADHEEGTGISGVTQEGGVTYVEIAGITVKVGHRDLETEARKDTYRRHTLFNRNFCSFVLRGE